MNMTALTKLKYFLAYCAVFAATAFLSGVGQGLAEIFAPAWASSIQETGLLAAGFILGYGTGFLRL